MIWYMFYIILHKWNWRYQIWEFLLIIIIQKVLCQTSRPHVFSTILYSVFFFAALQLFVLVVSLCVCCNLASVFIVDFFNCYCCTKQNADDVIFTAPVSKRSKQMSVQKIAQVISSHSFQDFFVCDFSRSPCAKGICLFLHHFCYCPGFSTGVKQM